MTLPRVVAWETTRRCDLACRHCRAAAGPARMEGELTSTEGLRLIEALAALPIQLLILTGGEPMMRPDIHELARAAASAGIRVVMAPCGPRLTDASAAQLRDAGISAVSLSLDAAEAAGHDAFRGVEGAFDATLRGLRCARQAGLAVQINTTVSRLNVAQLPAILDLAEREGVATLDFFFLVPVGRARSLKALQLDAEQVERTLQWISETDGTRRVRMKTTCAPQMARVRAQQGGKRAPGAPAGGCMAGRGFLFVSHAGIVQPCGFLDLPCGDVRAFDFDLQALLAAAGDLHRLGALEEIGGKCGTCTFLDLCGGCRARARAMRGDVLGEDPFCAWGDVVPRAQDRPPPRKRAIVTAMQQGVPLATRPFAALAGSLGVEEQEVLEVAHHMLEDGSARRFGAVFDARRLGYRSELCALSVAEASLDRVGALVAAHPGVTHCYLRGHPPGLPLFPALPGVDTVPNLWFTLAILHNRFDAGISRLQAEVAPLCIQRFPALRRFKIDVVFDTDLRDAGEHVPGPRTYPEATVTQGMDPLTETDRALVRALQGSVPVQSDFFAPIARALGCSVGMLLERLETWRQSGTLRRMALIVRHRRIGFSANAMCIWPVSRTARVEAGRRLAAWPAVTHCYERVTHAGWPYNLYAMIHTADWPATQSLFECISQDAGLTQGRMLGSLREFKKTSMQYFDETGNGTDE